MRELLGGKGANVAEMTRVLGAERVPAGFTITTEACVAYMNGEEPLPRGRDRRGARPARGAGRQDSSASPSDPLLVSVRERRARVDARACSTPSSTSGLNDESVEGLAKTTGNERFAWDSYRRFVQMFGNVCRGIPGERYQELIKEQKQDAGVERGRRARRRPPEGAHAGRSRSSSGRRPARTSRRTRRSSCSQAIRAVFDSWTGERAVEYRRINHIPDEWGTAVNVQQMVFGNKGDSSCSGVAFSRDEITGEPQPSGDFLPNAQGEDVVSGVRTPRDLHEMKESMPDAYDELMEILRTLESHYGDMQDTEFTVEEGSLYMLQTRNAKRPGAGGGAVRGRRGRGGAARQRARRSPRSTPAGSTRCCTRPSSRDADFDVLAEGVAASPGRREGRDRLHRRRRRPAPPRTAAT